MSKEIRKYNINYYRLEALVELHGGGSDVAREMGYPKSLISEHCNGKRKVSFDALVDYCNFFRVSADKLLGLTFVPTNEQSLLASEYTNLPMSIVNQLHENENRDAEFVAYMLKCRKEWDGND